jgi:hypothetical protein
MAGLYSEPYNLEFHRLVFLKWAKFDQKLQKIIVYRGRNVDFCRFLAGI